MLKHSVFAVVVAAIAIALVMSSAAAAESIEGKVGYGLMMDAGSTGSRVHVYRWVWHDGQKLPEVTDDFFLEVKPGLSSYKDEPAKAGPSLQKLFDFAAEHVPEADRKNVAVHLKATAGLRLLGDVVQEQLLDSVRDFISQQGYIFQREWVHVMSGEEEAVGAWVTVNYLLDRFEDGKKTVGIVDLGGGSVQIATLPSEGEAPKEALRMVDVAGTKYPLYVYSFLTYGLHQARKGIKDVAGDKCNIGSSGDAVACDAHTHKALKENTRAAPMLSIPAPVSDGEYLGFSYIYDILPPLGFPLDGERPTVQSLTAKAKEVCGASEAELEAKYGNAVKEGFLAYACSDVTYIANVMKHQLGFKDDEKRMFLGKQINGKELSWTLGLQLALIGATSNSAAKSEL